MTSGLVIVGVGTATLPESADAATTCPSGEHHRGNDCVAHSERSTLPAFPTQGRAPAARIPSTRGGVGTGGRAQRQDCGEAGKFQALAGRKYRRPSEKRRSNLL